MQEDSAASSEPEELDWDPRDGMHAEKRRPVSHLRAMFDTGASSPDLLADQHRGAGIKRTGSAAGTLSRKT